MKNFFYVLIPLFIILGCSKENSGGVKDARGETPVKYVICGQGESNCFVAARFKDIDGCESHKNWADMLCDSRSNPGKMVCTKDADTAFAVAFCTL